MKKNIYDNLKEVLKQDIDNNKLYYYNSVCNNCNLDDDLQYKNLEEKILGYLIVIEQLSISNYGIETNKTKFGIKIMHDLGISNIQEEKQFFTKLFMRDYQSKFNSKYEIGNNIKISKLYQRFASEKLKRDFEFNSTIINLDGKYIQGMSEDIKNNSNIVEFAIRNDSSINVKSFLSATKENLANPKLALLYFNKLKQNNSKFSAINIYKTIFEKNKEGNFPDVIFQGNVQNEWLKDNNFLAGIAQLDRNFVPFITSGKLSLVSDCNETNQKTKSF